ncbi:MAG TPA: hypothetical protein VFX22_06790 [Candidatus Kapabacteria bacterium]|nr:hypothetical protein [Candidatus Kapabacteria bacterium]
MNLGCVMEFHFTSIDRLRAPARLCKPCWAMLRCFDDILDQSFGELDSVVLWKLFCLTRYALKISVHILPL